MIDVHQTLQQRGARYGEFSSQADIAQGIKDVLAGVEHVRPPRADISEKWLSLAADQKEALEMIAAKMARIINGDPNYADSWHDIAGYARLVEDRLNAGDKKPS